MARALVSYGAGRVVGRYSIPTYNKIMAAKRIAAFAYRHRGKFRKAFRYATRKRRGFARRGTRNKRARVMGARGRAFTNREYVFASAAPSAAGDLQFLRRKELHIREIQFCGNADTNDDLRNAPGRRFWVSGVNLCTTFKNNTLNVPIRVHLAMVQPKEFESNPNTFSDDFFKSTGNANEMYENFNDATRVWNMDYDCLGINRRKFSILTHTKFIVKPKGDANNADREMHNFKHLEKYYKINKVFEFDNVNDNSVSKPIYCLIWWDSLLGTDGLPPESTDLGVIMRSTTYFKAAQAVTRF